MDREGKSAPVSVLSNNECIRLCGAIGIGQVEADGQGGIGIALNLHRDLGNAAAEILRIRGPEHIQAYPAVAAADAGIVRAVILPMEMIRQCGARNGIQRIVLGIVEMDVGQAYVLLHHFIRSDFNGILKINNTLFFRCADVGALGKLQRQMVHPLVAG